MFETVRNAFKLKEIRSRIIYTLLMLVVVRIGTQLPIPGVNGSYFSEWFSGNSGSAFGFFDAITGGSFEKMSVFALNITPYITSSIIIQLLTIAIPKLEELQKDGEEGRKKMTAITRYLTVALALMESLAMAIGFGKSGLSMGLMSCLVGIGTILLQSAINTLGTTVIVAHTAARKVFELVSLPNSVLGSAMATYCGQNYGARRFDRIRQGIRASLIIAAVWAVVVFLICHTIEGKLIQFVASTTNPDVIYWGSTYLKVDMSFIVICGVIVILRNSMQGFGDRVIPVFSSCIELAGKIIFAFVFAPMFAYWGIIWAEPMVWIAMVIPLIVKVVHVLKKEA